MSCATFSSACFVCVAMISSSRRFIASDLARLDLDVGRLPLEAARDLVDEDLRSAAVAMRLPFVPPARSSAPIDIAMPTQIVCTSGLMYCIVS